MQNLEICRLFNTSIKKKIEVSFWIKFYLFITVLHFILLFLTITAGAGLAVTPDVIKSYYADVERQHDQIKSSVAEYMSKFKVFH